MPPDLAPAREHILDPQMVAEAFEYIASQEVKILKTEELLIHIGTIDALAETEGLSPDQLGLLVEQLTSLPCPANLARKLLNCLVPADTVPASTLACLALWLAGDSSLSADRILLPALRVISFSLQYDAVSDKEEITNIYDMFLDILGREKLSKVVAELLNLLTTKQEVTEWRIKKVVNCQAKIGSSYELDKLLFTYRQLRPDLVPSCTAPAARSLARKDVLGRRFQKIWEERLERQLSLGQQENLWSTGPQSGNIYRKRVRELLVPSNEVLNVVSGVKAKKDERKNLNDMKTLFSIVENIHQLRLPANLLSLLGFRETYAVLVTDEELSERFSVTLYHLLRNEFLCQQDLKLGERDEERRRRRREDILERIACLQENIQQGLPVVGRFLSEYLDTWDGSKHFSKLLRLVSRLKITDHQELHDCIILPLIRHLKSYSQVRQLVLLMSFHELLQFWASVEFRRLNTYEKPLFSVEDNDESALESMSLLSVEIGEIASLVLTQAMEKAENVIQLTSSVLGCTLLSQTIMLKYKVPLRIEVPTAYVYSALFSHSAELLSLACQYLLTNKKDVLPAMKKAISKMELELGFNHRDVVCLGDQISEQAMLELQDVTRDVLLFLSPGGVDLTQGSILRLGWTLQEGEEWLKEKLYLSSHPAVLPNVLSYLDSLKIQPDEYHKAWELLSSEDEKNPWGKPPVASFYGKPANRPMPRSKNVGSIKLFLENLAVSLPCIEELLQLYRPKNEKPGAKPRRIVDQTDAASHITEDSGVQSIQTVQTSTPQNSREEQRSGRRSSGANVIGSLDKERRKRKSSSPNGKHRVGRKALIDQTNTMKRNDIDDI